MSKFLVIVGMFRIFFLFSCYPSSMASILSVSLEYKAVDGTKLRKISRKELKKRV